MNLYLQTRGNRRVEIGVVESEDEAVKIIEDLDHQFIEWEVAGFPADPFPPALKHWEGSDVYLENGDHTWMFTEFGWQEFYPRRSDR